MRLLFAATALFLLVAARPGWEWVLPAGMAPPAVPAGNGMSAAKVELGRRLFYDADLSADGTLACSGCHEQRHGFADSIATRAGVDGSPGRRNAPGLANVAWLPRLTFADPSVTSLEGHASTPLTGEHPVEMGMKGREDEFALRLGADGCYRRMFARAFPERRGRIDLASVTAALAAFQRTMISYDSPYDRHRAGDGAALSPLQQEGERLFRGSGCASCHSGPQLTDADYHRLETVNPADEGPADEGLAEQTGAAADRGRFRTPSLRNVAVSGPWWHDGTASTIEAAVRRHGLALPDAALPPILAFLDGLTDEGFLRDPRLSRPDTACGRRL